MKTIPILFNTEMVQAILDGRKTVTRRLLKPQPTFPGYPEGVTGRPVRCDDGSWCFDMTPFAYACEGSYKPPCEPGDILYVRETWRVQAAHRFEADARIEFKAGGQMVTIQFPGRCSDSHERPTYDEFIGKWGVSGKWRPSLHMPKEAARIFLRVKDVRVERLQDITVDQAAAEGIDSMVPSNDAEELCNYCPLPDEAKGVRCYGGTVHMCEGSRCGEAMDSWEEEYLSEFSGLWNSTIKPADIPTYGWDANPYVWVIEFEKISKEEAVKC